MDDDDFLAAVEADNANVPVEEPKEEKAETLELTEEAPPEPVQDPPAEQPEPAQPEPKPEPQNVPLAAHLDERERRQAAEARAKAAEERLAAQQQPQQVPDMFEDPDGYSAYQDQKVQAALYQANLRWSERIATSEHGKETVAEAKKWGIERCETDPYFNAKVGSSEDPVGFVVMEWKREQIASQVSPDDFAQFQAWKQAQAQLQAPAPDNPAPPTSPRTPPPRSLASAPSAGGVLTEVAQAEEEIFEEIMPKR